MKPIGLMLLFSCISSLPLQLAAQTPLKFGSGDRVIADAHNCYPYDGRWNDRIERALNTPFSPIKHMSDAEVIEKQLVKILHRRDLHPMGEAQGIHALLHPEEPTYTSQPKGL